MNILCVLLLNEKLDTLQIECAFLGEGEGHDHCQQRQQHKLYLHGYNYVKSLFKLSHAHRPNKRSQEVTRLGSTDAVTCLRNSVAPLSVLVGWRSLHAD